MIEYLSRAASSLIVDEELTQLRGSRIRTDRDTYPVRRGTVLASFLGKKHQVVLMVKDYDGRFFLADEDKVMPDP